MSIARHGADGYDVTVHPMRLGQAVRPRERLASFGVPAWRWSSCYAPGTEPRAWTDIAGASDDPFRTLVWISAGDCVPAGRTLTRVRVSSCLTGISLEVVIPTGQTKQGPAVAPCAPVPPPSPISWKQTEENGPDLCGAATPRYLADVGAALEGEPTTTPEGEAAFYTRLAPRLRAKGYDVALYGEELAVAKDSSRSENYDLLAWGPEIQANRLRVGPGSYQTTCSPATRSAPIPATAPPPPLPTPGGGGATWPQQVAQVRAKVHVPSAERGDGRAVLDAVALACGAFCSPRACCPACGPEGTPGRLECDASLAPVWEGGQAHDSNPWLRFAHPGERARVCVGAACSEWVTAQ